MTKLSGLWSVLALTAVLGAPAFAEGETADTVVASVNGAYAAIAADIDGDGDLDLASTAFDDARVAWHENLGRGVFDDGFDSDANRACWSSSVP